MTERFAGPSGKRPVVLVPFGPLAWASYQQILPELIKVWRMAGFRIESVLFPRPKIDQEWVSKLKLNASVLIFPMGIAHHDSLWTLRKLRTEWGLRIPAVIMIASDLTKGGRLLLNYRECLLAGDIFVVNCTAEARLVRLALGSHCKIQVIPLPVAIDKFQCRSAGERNSYKQKLGMNKNQPLIVYAGRVSLQKNIHTLIEGFSRIVNQYPTSRLVIAGAYDDIGTPHLPEEPRPRYLHLLSKMILELDLEKRVCFLDALEQVPLARLLGSCDALVSTTTHSGEDFGYAIAQGLAAGAPTVVTSWGGGNDFVSGGGALGVPVNINERGPHVIADAFARALADILEPKTNRSARIRARRYARNVLSLRSCAKLWRKNCENLPPSHSPLRVDISQDFWSHVHRAGGITGNQFRSPRDKLFQKICRIYAGHDDLSRKTQVRKTSLGSKTGRSSVLCAKTKVSL